MTAPPPLNVDSVQRRLVAIRGRLGELGQVDNLTVDGSAVTGCSAPRLSGP